MYRGKQINKGGECGTMIYGLMMAKKNSTRLKNKNLKEFAEGLSLFEFSLKENLKYPWYDDFFVISDDPEIEEICKKYNVIFIKEPQELANDNNSWNVIFHVIKASGIFADDILVYVPGTTPLRLSKDIKEALQLYIDNINDCDSVVSVCKCREPPEWSFMLDKDGYLDIERLPMTSQELETYYHLNAALYISSISKLMSFDGYFEGKVLPYIMPPERSIDIDSEHDFEMAQYYYRRKKYGKLRREL